MSGCVFESNDCNTGFPEFDGWGGAVGGVQSNLTVDSCVFTGNIGDHGGAVHGSESSILVIRNSTFFANLARLDAYGAVLRLGYYWDNDSSTASVDNCILAYNDYGVPVGCQDSSNVAMLTCCDVYGNPGGDWIGVIADQAEINGNLSLDPQFCDTASWDLTLNPLSPCLPANNPCQVLVGALGEGCDCCVNRGDINHDGTAAADITDLVHLVEFMFTQGNAPPCTEEADLNTDGTVDIADLIYLVDYMFNSGPAPLPCP